MAFKAAKKTKPKPAPPERPPNFPKHELPEPYSRLLLLDGDDYPELYDEIAAELKASGAQEGAQKLLEMALDETYYDYQGFYKNEKEYYENETRLNTRFHAVRVLSRMGKAAEIGIEPLLPLMTVEDDWLREEMPHYYAAMGRPSVDSLQRLLFQEIGGTDGRVDISEALKEVAEKNPELRPEVITILEQMVVNVSDDPELVGFVISDLLDLDAQESYPLIERAYQEERVDDYIVSLSEVRGHFEMDAAESPSPQALPRNNYAPSVPYVGEPKIGRNEPCPCGSGKKYKQCCG